MAVARYSGVSSAPGGARRRPARRRGSRPPARRRRRPCPRRPPAQREIAAGAGAVERERAAAAGMSALHAAISRPARRTTTVARPATVLRGTTSPVARVRKVGGASGRERARAARRDERAQRRARGGSDPGKPRTATLRADRRRAGRPARRRQLAGQHGAVVARGDGPREDPAPARRRRRRRYPSRRGRRSGDPRASSPSSRSTSSAPEARSSVPRGSPRARTRARPTAATTRGTGRAGPARPSASCHRRCPRRRRAARRRAAAERLASVCSGIASAARPAARRVRQTVVSAVVKTAPPPGSAASRRSELLRRVPAGDRCSGVEQRLPGATPIARGGEARRGRRRRACRRRRARSRRRSETGGSACSRPSVPAIHGWAGRAPSSATRRRAAAPSVAELAQPVDGSPSRGPRHPAEEREHPALGPERRGHLRVGRRRGSSGEDDARRATRAGERSSPLAPSASRPEPDLVADRTSRVAPAGEVRDPWEASYVPAGV